MSKSTESLRHKIDSAADLQGVVRTMKALAASSIGQYEKAVLALADYYRTVELGLAACIRHRESVFPSTQPPRTDISGIVFGSDQGLVGQFNDVVVDFAISKLVKLPGQQRIWAVGDRVHARLADAGLSPQGVFALPNSVAAIGSLIGKILVASTTSHDELGELHLFYNRPSAGSAYAPVSERLLPLDETWCRRLAEAPWPTHNLPELVGQRDAMLRALVREFLYISLFRACTESLASENASRLAAMERADRNIDELLRNLRCTFHRLRQSDIDDELFDVISGFEALRVTPQVA
jgi:F-type H+-transporting ATPase subunit gamma